MVPMASRTGLTTEELENRKKKYSMLRTTALTSYGSIVATDLSSRASSDARGGGEAVDGVGSLMLFLPANGFVAPAGIARHAAPGNAGADADSHRAAKTESGRPQA